MTRWLLPISGGLVIIIVLLGWIALAPQALGGRAMYVTTAGASMEPSIAEGDLVVLRKSRSYEVGDVVAYDAGNSIVLHRIIGTHGDRFILQGDNNPTPDTIQPTLNEIRGQLWLLLSPPWEWDIDDVRLFAIALIVLAILMVVAYLARARISGIKAVEHLRERAQDAQADERYARMLGPSGQALVVVIAVLGAGALLLAVAGFSRPLEVTVVERIPYQHVGTFRYSAPAVGPVYEDGIATTGDPLYRDLIDAVTVDVHYRLASELPVDAGGAYRIDMVVRNNDGWSTALALMPERQFSGGQFEETVVFELLDLEMLIAAFEEQTGLTASAEPIEYQLSIAPTVRVDGVVGGQQIHDTFSPSLSFQVDDQTLSLLPAQGNGGPATDSATNPTETGVSGAVTAERLVPNEVAFVIGDLSVATARQLAIVGLALAIILGIAALFMIRAAMRAPESAQIEARYGSRIVDLRAANLKTSGRIVEVAAFEDLIKVADRRDLHILHYQRNGKDFYIVHTVEMTYGYRVTSNHQQLGAQQPTESAQAKEETLPKSP